MSGTQQWPPPTPPRVVFSPPEPVQEPEVRPVRAPKAEQEPEAGSRPFGELTDDELAEELTRARSHKAQLTAEARRRAGKPLGRTGPNREHGQPWRDRSLIAGTVAEGLSRGQEVTVKGIMRSQQCGHTVAVQVMALLEDGGVVEKDTGGRWYAK